MSTMNTTKRVAEILTRIDWLEDYLNDCRWQDSRFGMEWLKLHEELEELTKLGV